MPNWQLYIINGTNAEGFLRRPWLLAYKMWKEVWKSAFDELKVEKTLYSDEFTRTEDILALFDGEQCLMVLFYRPVDLSLTVSQEDSYFGNWPTEALRELMKYSPYVVVCSNTTVAFQARSLYQGHSIKKLLGALTLRYLENSPCSALTGALRNNKGMNQVGYDSGARKLAGPVIMHGVEVDLVGLYKSEVQSFRHEYHELSLELWKNRIDYRDEGLDKKLIKRAA